MTPEHMVVYVVSRWVDCTTHIVNKVYIVLASKQSAIDFVRQKNAEEKNTHVWFEYETVQFGQSE